MDSELGLLQQRIVADCPHSVRDAWRQSLDLARLLPFPLACVCRFASYCGVAEEYVLLPVSSLQVLSIIRSRLYKLTRNTKLRDTQPMPVIAVDLF